ncbi:MAG: hypothetical protein PF638_08780 [Candidatus Delongbacteria bacterium]|jgi:hypothetical protein|nr:hypothetical protein [Candidatus Delongbacteria bacterium]
MNSKIIYLPKFTPKARKRWDEIPKGIQAKLLGNAWCGKCQSSVSMILQNAKVETEMLLLEGKCKVCDCKVVRVVEPE